MKKILPAPTKVAATMRNTWKPVNVFRGRHSSVKKFSGLSGSQWPVYVSHDLPLKPLMHSQLPLSLQMPSFKQRLLFTHVTKGVSQRLPMCPLMASVLSHRQKNEASVWSWQHPPPLKHVRGQWAVSHDTYAWVDAMRLFVSKQSAANTCIVESFSKGSKWDVRYWVLVLLRVVVWWW